MRSTTTRTERESKQAIKQAIGIVYSDSSFMISNGSSLAIAYWKIQKAVTKVKDKIQQIDNMPIPEHLQTLGNVLFVVLCFSLILTMARGGI